MKNFYKYSLSKTTFLIFLFGLLAATCIGQTERIIQCKETDYSCRNNNYNQTAFSKCKAEGSNYNCLINQYTKIIESNPNDPAAYFTRGLFSSFKQPDQSALDFSKTLELNPKYMVAYVMLASIYRRKNEYDQAIKILDKAVELDPKFANAYGNRGFAYLQKGDFEKAFADYNKVVELEPKDDLGYVGRAMVYSRQGNFEKTIESYNKAIELNPDYWLIYYNRGYQYWKQNEKIKAEADCQKAKELKPEQDKGIGTNQYCSF